MAAWNGQPVLARTSAAQIPAVEARFALDGLQDGFDGAVNYARQHNVVGESAFIRALHTAQAHPDYDYSHQFLAGVEAAKPLLAVLAAAERAGSVAAVIASGMRTAAEVEQYTAEVREAGLEAARAEENRIAAELAASRLDEDQPLAVRGHGHQLLGATYPMSDHVLAEGLLAEHGQEWPR